MLYHHRCPSFRGERGESEGITKYICFFFLLKKKQQHEKGTIEGRLTLRICHSVGVFWSECPRRHMEGFSQSTFQRQTVTPLAPSLLFFLFFLGGGLRGGAWIRSYRPVKSALIHLAAPTFFPFFLSPHSVWHAIYIISSLLPDRRRAHYTN